MLAPFGGTRGRIIAQAAVLTAVVGGSVAYSAINKTVTLEVDGTQEEVRAFGGTVADLLEDQDLKVGPKDIVAPAPKTDLDDGDKVVVRYARPLTLQVDGQQRTHWTTELNVDGALAALGVRADGARLSASRSARIGRAGMSMWLSTPKQVTLRADGKARALTTAAPTVSELLTEQKVAVRPADKLSALPQTRLTNGAVVTLTRIDRKRVTATEKVPFEITKKNSDDLFKGDTKVVTPGKQGARTAVYDVVLADGKVTSKKLVSATVTAPPVAQVVSVGTKKKPSAGGGGGDAGPIPSSGGLNWAALAKCESGGNPRAVNPNGYYGLYQFSLPTWRSVGGSGNPADASSAEQTKRAQMLYDKAGRGQWPHCGRYL